MDKLLPDFYIFECQTCMGIYKDEPVTECDCTVGEKTEWLKIPVFRNRSPMQGGEIEEIQVAIKVTGYKHFGDYEFSECQRKAVDTLVRTAKAYLANHMKQGDEQGENNG